MGDEASGRPFIALPSAVARIYEAVAELEAAYPGRKFAPDGHLVGSIGEAVAAEAFGPKLLSMSAEGHDAVDAEGCLVQVKMTGGRSVSLYGDCQRLIVLRITVCRAQAEIGCGGRGEPVIAKARAASKNWQRRISLARLRKIAVQKAVRSGTRAADPAILTSTASREVTGNAACAAFRQHRRLTVGRPLAKRIAGACVTPSGHRFPRPRCASRPRLRGSWPARCFSKRTGSDC